MIVLLCLPGWAEPEPSEPAAPPEATEEAQDETDFMRPSGGQLGIGGDEGFGLGTAVGDPTALNGPTRTPIVLFGTDRESLIDLTGYYSHKFNSEHRLLVEGSLDPNYLGLDVSYTISPKAWEGALTFNSWIASGSFAPYEAGGREIFLPPNRNAHVQMLGGGVEYVQPFTEELDVAFGLNYQQYAFSTALLGGSRYRVDSNGFPLTVANRSAAEDFLGFRIHGLFSTLDDRDLPIEGTKIRFGMEQSIGLGAPSFNQLSANVAHLFRMPGFNDGDHSLLVNLQAGTNLGEPPPIRAFHMGGAQSVRGYDPGELASGKSFLQTTVEYRHHLHTFNLFDTDFHARLALFHDYGTTLGTADQLRGMPPILLGKPEHAYGYGAGIHLASEYGLFRLESAWNGQGQNSFYFTVGERF